MEGNTLDIAIKCCQRQIHANKIASINNSSGSHVQPQAASIVSVCKHICDIAKLARLTIIVKQNTFLSQAPTPQVPVNSTSPQLSQNHKPHKNLMSSTGRPRGRPPNVNKYLQGMQPGSNMMNQFGSKSNFASYMGASGPNRSMMNPYFMSPLVDPTMLSALLASGLGGNMMDPLSAMSYLNQMGSYQDILRQYQSNLSSLSNLAGGLNNPGTTITGISNTPSTMSTTSSSINTSSNIGNLSNLSSMTVQQLLSLSNSTASTSRPAPMYHQAAAKTSTTMSMTKDRPSISITPVSSGSFSQQSHKTKPSGMKQPSVQTDALPVHIPKSLQISPTKPIMHSPNTAQVSLLKPSVIQQVKTSPPKQISAPQIRVSKSLTEPQPAHNPSLSHSPLKSGGATNPTIVPQVAHTVGAMGAPVIMKQSMPMNLPASRTGTSLQHKLLSKKNSQRPFPQMNPARKTKVATSKTMPVLSANYPNLLTSMPGSSAMSQPPFIPPELSGISVSAVTQPPGIKTAVSAAKYHSYKKSSVNKSKPTTTATAAAATTTVDVPSSLPASFSQSSSVEALSMLSQLQQHSHLEIIPQQKVPLKPSMDYAPKGLSSSVTVMPQKVSSEALRPSTAADCMPIYDVPRGKPPSANVSSKKTDKLATSDSVEIITLDD